MERPVLQSEQMIERHQTSRKVVLVMFLALFAWLIVAIAQGIVACGGLFGGFKK
ncbi:hypothetical protein BH09BAC1_BH09BAC1_21710 [soil metagenome]